MSNTILIFTSGNTIISANNNPLGFVQTMDIEDVVDSFGERYSQITLHRLVDEHENIINDMRSGPFIFKVCKSDGSGYVSINAEVIGFKMHLAAKKDMDPIEFLEQTIIIKAKSFFYVADARSAEMKIIEEQDATNLIKIIKEHQAKNRGSTVLPIAEQIAKEEDEKILEILNSAAQEAEKKKKNKKRA